MAKGASDTAPVTSGVAAAAASVAPSENRSVTEQINYWVRIGMQVERATSVDGRRLLAVVAGDAQFSTLAPPEQAIAHATIDARIAERVAEQRFGLAARKAGQVTVSIDDDGTLIEISPDGSRRPL